MIICLCIILINVNSLPLISIQNITKLNEECIILTSRAIFNLSSIKDISYSKGDTTIAIHNLCNHQIDPKTKNNNDPNSNWQTWLPSISGTESIYPSGICKDVVN